ncbi:MAG: hypothetical protein M3552_12380 [Planctomycetota bacterium]|nr:hypothetical protein [Planctomycetota bacterium]
MSAAVACLCGEVFPAFTTIAVCPRCQRPLPVGVTEGGDDRSEPQEFIADAVDEGPSQAAVTRMFEALLDPRSIHRLLSLGGTLAVAGLIVWLVSVGVFENPLNQAVAFGLGSAALFAGGWWLSLRTRYRLAGESLAFLASVVAPLNLWFYDAQNLLTVEGHLWAAGLVCCGLYAATIFLLRKPLFLYAFQAGATLTGLLLLADLKSVGVLDVSLMLAVFGFLAIHLERVFPQDGEFDRRRFGPPLLWTGLTQFGLALAALLPLQIAHWAELPLATLAWFIDAGRLEVSPIVAAGLWLAAAYSAFYVATVPRLAGGWTLLAACGCLLMAETTILINADATAEGAVVALALTAAVACMASSRLVERGIVPRHAALGSAVVISSLPLFMGYLLFARGVMPSFRAFGWERAFGAAYPLSMTLTAACLIASAISLRGYVRHAAILRFLTAGTVLLATAGSVRLVETPWSMGAAILTLIPIAYLVEGMWRKDEVDVSIAYTAFGLFSASAFLAVCHQGIDLFIPRPGKVATLGTAIVALEAAVFLLMAASRAERSRQTLLAGGLSAVSAGALAVMLWQGLGYADAEAGVSIPIFAATSLLPLAVSRSCGRRSLAQPAFIAGAVLLLATVLIGNFRATGLMIDAGLLWRHAWELGSLAITSLVAAALAPAAAWRRVFATAAGISTAVTVLAIAGLADLTGWQRLEAFSVTIGLLLLVSGHVARFRERVGQPDELVDVSLWLGAAFAIVPLAIAMLYHRVELTTPSLADELALSTIGVLMLASGLAWQLKATTLVGGGAFGGYLIVLIASLLRRPEVTMGAYLAGTGITLFAVGIALSVYRDRLLLLPEKIVKRQGIFRVLEWR